MSRTTTWRIMLVKSENETTALFSESSLTYDDAYTPTCQELLRHIGHIAQTAAAPLMRDTAIDSGFAE